MAEGRRQGQGSRLQQKAGSGGKQTVTESRDLQKKGQEMQGHSNRRGRSRDVRLTRTVPYNGREARYARAARRRRNAYIRLAAMFLVTAVLLFISGRAVYRLIVPGKPSQATGASGASGAGPLGSSGADIVTLAENIRDQVPQEPDPAVGAGENGVLIAIDPGHGGYDNGSNIDGIYEQVITMEISFRLAEKLQEMGYETLLLREDNDTHLFPEERVEMAENAKADAYVSIHLNTYDDDTSVAGMETWYAEKNDGSAELASMVQKAASRSTGARDRGLKVTKELIVVRDTTMPSCLMETGFLTNRAEREALMSEEYQEKLAEGIAQGIDEFMRSKGIVGEDEKE